MTYLCLLCAENMSFKNINLFVVLISCCSFTLSQLTAKNAEPKSNSTGGLIENNRYDPEETNNSSNQPLLNNTDSKFKSKTLKLMSSNKKARSSNHVPRFTPGNESLCFVVKFFARHNDDNFLTINRLENIMGTLAHSHQDLIEPSPNVDNHNHEHAEENDSHSNEIPSMLIRNTTTDNYVSLSDPGNFSRNINKKKHHSEENSSFVINSLGSGSEIQISGAATCDTLKPEYHKVVKFLAFNQIIEDVLRFYFSVIANYYGIFQP